MDTARTVVSIRLSLIEKLRDIVSRDQSPMTRLFDSKRASRAQICECALEIAEWVSTGEMGKQLVDGYEPEFKQRLGDVDKNAYMRGATAMAKFLGAGVEVDAERRVVTVTPPAALKDVGIGELDARPLVEPKIPAMQH